MRKPLVMISLLLSAFNFACQQQDQNLVLFPVEDDPTVSFRILFKVGSQNDPPGKEGLAALTATMITEGATQKHAYEEILALLYPMAASIDNQVDKEMTVFSGRTHMDNLNDYYAILREVLLEPAFNEDDFNRVKKDFLNYVQTSLRYAQDEELGKETLYEYIFAGTPYEHNEEGHVAGLDAITLDDVRRFYQTHYTRDNLLIGLGGGYEPGFTQAVAEDFRILPAGKATPVPVSQPQPIEGMQVKIVEKDASATAISFGFPIEITRGSKDFYALAVATAWLGEHRSSFSHLYQVIRGKRGLNYGDYAYIEHFPNGHLRQFPPPNVARRRQIFQIWIRPVPHEAQVFAFRAALRELRKLVDSGMSAEDFELSRKFLKNYILNYAPTTMMKLGYALDDRFYGIEAGHWNTFSRMLQELTLEDVNAALKKYWTYRNIKAVFITRDGESLKNTLVNNLPSPIEYQSEKPAEILQEDEEIATYPLSVEPQNVTIVEVDEMFEG